MLHLRMRYIGLRLVTDGTSRQAGEGDSAARNLSGTDKTQLLMT